MRFVRSMQWMAATLAVAGMFVNAPLAMAANTAAASKGQVRDVALGTKGALQGQMVDPQGNPKGATVVSLRQSGREVASVFTKADGTFRIEGVRGGNYQVVAAGTDSTYRLWAADTAPPSAKSSLLLVSDGPQVRGNLSHAQVVSTLGAVALIIGVGYAIYEIADDDSGS